MKQLPVRQACAEARCPGLLVVLSATLHQSTLFCALRLAGSDSTGALDTAMGVLAVLVCLALPVVTLLAAAQTPRRFVAFQCREGSVFAAGPLACLTPSGYTLPRMTRLHLSSVITTYAHPSLLCIALPFFSSFVSNGIAVLPEASPSWVCAGAMYLSAMLHGVVAGAIGIFQPYRFTTSTVFGVVGMLLTAAFHAQMASDVRGAVDATLTAQAGLSLLRSIVAACLSLVERHADASGNGIAVAAVVDPQAARRGALWNVGSGGVDIDAALLAQRPASALQLPDDDGQEMLLMPLLLGEEDAPIAVKVEASVPVTPAASAAVMPLTAKASETSDVAVPATKVQAPVTPRPLLPAKAALATLTQPAPLQPEWMLPRPDDLLMPLMMPLASSRPSPFAAAGALAGGDCSAAARLHAVSAPRRQLLVRKHRLGGPAASGAHANPLQGLHSTQQGGADADEEEEGEVPAPDFDFEEWGGEPDSDGGSANGSSSEGDGDGGVPPAPPSDYASAAAEVDDDDDLT